MASPHAVLRGIDVSAGTAAAKAVIVRFAPGVDENEAPCTGPVAEGERVRGALAAVSASLKEQARKAPKKSAPILRATAQFVADRGLAKAINKKPGKGLGATQAVRAAVEEYAEMLRGLGGYMAERTTDPYDVCDCAICELRGLPAPGVPTFGESVVLVIRDLVSAETATLNPETVKGIITGVGGPTSYTAILTAQLGIPAIVKVTGILEVNEGDPLALDGGVGEVAVSPTAEEVELFEERLRRRALVLVGSSGEGVRAPLTTAAGSGSS